MTQMLLTLILEQMRISVCFKNPQQFNNGYIKPIHIGYRLGRTGVIEKLIDFK